MSNQQQTFESAVQAHQSGNLTEAERLYRQILAVEPAHVDAMQLLGVVASQTGRGELAIAQFRAALRHNPNALVIHFNLGNVLAQLGRFAEAQGSFAEAVRLKPDFAEAHANLGHVFKALGKPAEAEVSYRQALHWQPDYADGHHNLGIIMLEQGRWTEAAACFRQALRVDARHVGAHHDLGVALMKLGQVTEAVASYEQALRLQPDFAEAHNNLGNAFKSQANLEEAVACYRQALCLKPDFAEAYNNLGNALKVLGKVDEAVANYRHALSLRPSFSDAHFNLGMALLLQGNFEEGWQEFEWRWWKLNRRTAPANFPPLWDGKPLVGRTILLHSEYGMGDCFQFIRYAPLVKRLGGAVVLTCQRPLTRLLATAPGIDRLVPSDGPVPEADVYAPLMTLPHLLRTTLASVPADVPYLTAEPDLVEQWKRKLGPPAGLRVGIAWQGSPSTPGDRERSVPVRHFAPLARLEGVRLFSLQKGFGSEQLAEIAGQVPVTDLAPELEDFMDTAALMRSLDLVITSDTAIPHLAGALGVPVWLALPFAPDWRWLLDRDDSPWYPTMRIFRQQTRGDWPGVFERIAAALREVLVHSERDDLGRHQGLLGRTSQ